MWREDADDEEEEKKKTLLFTKQKDIVVGISWCWIWSSMTGN